MSFNDYLEKKLLDLVLSNDAYSVSAIYLALWIGNPGEDGSGGTEASGNGYARAVVTGKWGNAAGDPTVVANTAEITFPTASGEWGEGPVTHFAIFDALSGGNMLMYSNLAVSRTITSGSIPRFALGALKVYLE